MPRKRKVHGAAFKTQVALRGDRTVSELAGQFEVHPTLINGWKKQLYQGAEAFLWASRKLVESLYTKAAEAELSRKALPNPENES